METFACWDHFYPTSMAGINFVNLLLVLDLLTWRRVLLIVKIYLEASIITVFISMTKDVLFGYYW